MENCWTQKKAAIPQAENDGSSFYPTLLCSKAKLISNDYSIIIIFLMAELEAVSNL